MKKVYRFVCKNVEYLILLVLLSLVVWLTLHYFKKEQTTQIISVLGISFALFQFLFNQISTKKRRNNDLRYEAYKEIITQFETVAETANCILVTTLLLDVNSLLTKLVTQLVRLQSTITINNNHLFPKISETKESKAIEELVWAMVRSTDRFRLQIEKVIDMGNAERNNFLKNTTSKDWQKELFENLVQLHKDKYKFYHRLRQYFD